LGEYSGTNSSVPKVAVATPTSRVASAWASTLDEGESRIAVLDTVRPAGYEL
jgi:hypothetical protein